MADRVRCSDDDSEGRSRESMHCHQSVWMAHWMRTSCDARGQVINAFGNNENICDMKHHHAMSQTESASDIARSRTQIGEIKTRTFDILNETVRARNPRNEEQGCQSFPVAGPCRSSQSSSAFQNGEETSGIQAPVPWIDRNIEIGKVSRAMSTSCIPSAAAAAAEAEISSREIHYQPESKFKKPMGQVKTHAFFRESSFPVSKPLQESFPGSVSDIVLYRSGNGSNRFESGRRAMSSFMEAPFLSSNGQFPRSNLKKSETDDCHYHSHPTYLLGRQPADNHTNSGRPLTSYFRQNIMSLLPNDPSTSDHRSPEFGGEQLKLQNFSGLRQLQFPHQGNSSELTRSGKLHHGYCSLQKLPHSVHDGETMTIRACVDSVVGLSGDYPRYSQTTRRLLITDKTDVSLNKQKEVITNFGVASQVNRNAYLDLHRPSPFFSCGQQGVKIQSLGSSTDSEGKENIEDIKASKVILENESSAETDIMDMDAFMEKHQVSGVNSSPTNKGIVMDPKSSQFPSDYSGMKIGRKHVNTKLPDMNLEFCALSAGGNSKDVAEPSSSKTQSLDMDLLLGHAEQTNYSTSNPCPDNSLKPDPTERWIKRLKFSALDSVGLGTQISNLEDFSCKKVNKHFNMTTSEPEEHNNHGKELNEPDETTTLLRNRESPSVDTAKRGKALLLSQSWIQRWLHNQARTPRKESEALLLSEPQSSKLAMDDFPKKHCPSIAAMALMGKAMNGFQPCQMEKRGSFVFWNRKEA